MSSKTPWSGQARSRSLAEHEEPQKNLSGMITFSSNSKSSAIVTRFLAKPFPPLIRQLPTIALYLLAIILTLASPAVTVTNEFAILASGLGILIGAIVVFFLSREESRWHLTLIVPAIDLVAIVALQYGTNGTDSVFATFAFILLIWFCMETGPQHVALAVVGMLLTVGYALFVFLGHPPHLAPASEYLKDAFAFAVLCVVLGAIAITFLQEAHVRKEKSELITRQAQQQLTESRRHTEEMAKSQALVRESDRLIRQLWDASTLQCSIGTDVTGMIDAWNPGAVRMLGLTSDQTVGVCHIDDFLLPAELAEWTLEKQGPVAPGPHPGFAALVEPARRGPSEVREWTYVRHDESLVAVELSVSARVDDNGETTGYLFVAHDLTKSNEVARLKDEFIGLISHELRTPLSSILGYLELMRDENDDDVTMSEQQLDYLGIVERNAQRLLGLVGDLLFTAQVESGKFPLDVREQALGPILESSVESARPVAATAGITVRLDIVDDQLVNVDSGRLCQACDNLISNAIKFTPRDGTVTVAVTADRNNAIVTVSDTGIGIPADELDQLFSRFFRATTATQNAIQGVGLGLVITRAIVVAHGGTMDVSSEEGVGTTFSMMLPLLVPADGPGRLTPGDRWLASKSVAE